MPREVVAHHPGDSTTCGLQECIREADLLEHQLMAEFCPTVSGAREAGLLRHARLT
jgi:hypothetical protein